MIECLPVTRVKPEWEVCSGDRYMSHPGLRVAFIQLMDSPEKIYCVSDQALPRSLQDAVEMITSWRIACDTNEE